MCRGKVSRLFHAHCTARKELSYPYLFLYPYSVLCSYDSKSDNAPSHAPHSSITTSRLVLGDIAQFR